MVCVDRSANSFEHSVGIAQCGRVYYAAASIWFEKGTCGQRALIEVVEYRLDFLESHIVVAFHPCTAF